MKKRILCIIAILIIQMIGIPAVYADTNDVVSFEPGSLVVKGEKDFGALEYPVDVTVTGYDKNGQLNYIDVIPVGKDGKMSFKYYNTGISGDYTYTFVIGSLGRKETATMTGFIGRDYWDQYCAEVNGYADNNDFANFKSKILNEANFNLNLDEYNALASDSDRDRVFNVMLADYNTETGYKSADEIKTSFKDSVSFVKYATANDAKSYYNAVGTKLGIPAGTKGGISVLDEVSDVAQAAVYAAVNAKINDCSGMKKTAELFLNNTLYTVIESAGHYTDVKYVMNAYIDAGLLDEEKDLSEDIYKKLMNKKFATEQDIKDAVKKAKEGISENPPSDKPSGGGGGGSRPVAAKPTNPEIEKPEATPKPQGTTGVNTAKMTFSDMEDVKWAIEAVDTLYEKGIIAGVGDGKFDPHSYVTREQFARMLCELGGFDAVATNVAFTDVDKNSWSYPYICTAYSNGIISGISNTKFAPTDIINREQAVAMLYRMVGKNFEEYSGTFVFDDDAEISQWAKLAVYGLHDLGIVNGRTSKTFSAKESMTRVEAAALLFNAVSKIAW